MWARKFFTRESIRERSTRLVEDLEEKIAKNVVHTALLCAMRDLNRLIDDEGRTLLHYAVDNNAEASTIRWLLDHGLDVNAQTRIGQTPLLLAMKRLNEEAIGVLLKANADINFVNDYEKPIWQMLDVASTLNSTIPGALVMNVVNKCETEEEAALKLFEVKCPIYLAVMLRNTKIIENLLELGVDLYECNPCMKITALHMAARIQDPESVELLLTRGIDINVKDICRRTPVAHIRPDNYKGGDQLKVLQTFLDRGAELTTCDSFGNMQISRILRESNKDAIRLVLQANRLDMSTKDKTGSTPIHYLAANPRPDTFEVMQNLQAKDMNFTIGNRWTTLHTAASEGHPNVLRFLLDRGADVNAQTDFGITPLECALTRQEKQYEQIIECVEVLLQYGADAQVISPYDKAMIIDVFEINSYPNPHVIKPILAHLATLEADGTAIKHEISTNMNLHFEIMLNLCKQQLSQFKTINIWESVTVFQLLTEPEKKLAVYLRNRELVAELGKIDYKNNQHIYFYQKLQRRITRALRTVQITEQATVILYKITQISYETHPTIIDKICNYLNESDLLKLAQV